MRRRRPELLLQRLQVTPEELQLRRLPEIRQRRPEELCRLEEHLLALVLLKLEELHLLHLLLWSPLL
jgi:hypothetical protein